jgi:hypothetical protein
LAGDFGRAEYLYCKLISHAEDHPARISRWERCTHSTTRMEGQLTFLKRAIELQPDGNGAMENLAAVYREMEDRDKARYWGERP